ncbi:hypothetical protein ACF1AO_33860 [Streptomyces longwoodensis]|uniref:hypothetical protein n=1 Tax=Streptomyces longwoodensis TaxID=68231 RepID=UPI0037006C7A
MLREISGTIGLLTDEHDFRTMRHYRSFAFDDYATYLAEVEDVLRARDAQGAFTMLTLFDPAEYAEFCAEQGIDPDSPSSRARFTAEIATTGAAIAYDGQPLTTVIPALMDQAVRSITWELASTLLARLGPCPNCGKDVGHEAFAYARDFLGRILDTAGPGRRQLVCSVSATPESLVAVLRADTDDYGATHLDDAEALEFTTVLALGLTSLPGGLVMRTITPSGAERVCGWQLQAGEPAPLTAGEAFDAYCTDVDSGDPVAPESDVDYCAPPDLGPAAAGLRHHC